MTALLTHSSNANLQKDMSTQSNQGPPDLDVVLRELVSFLFKRRNQRKKSKKQSTLIRTLDQGTKKRPDKTDDRKRTAPATDINTRIQEQVQNQINVKPKHAISNTPSVTVASKNDTRKAVLTPIAERQVVPSRTLKPITNVKKKVSADTTRKWLHDSRALRQAFVLKELLEPPVALRKRTRRRYS